MSQKFIVNQNVFIPATKIKKLDNYPFALYEGKIVQVKNKSIKIELKDGSISEFIGSSSAHSNTGIIILTIGDIDTEETLLNPLRKSILQFSRLLLKDDYIYSLFCRSKEELALIWKKYSCSYSYLILIGHGSKNGLHFAVDKLVKVEEIIEILERESCAPKHIISLCCKTGYKNFASKISNSTKCIEFIAPFQSIHGAEASQFVQTFLNSHLLEGKSTTVAFKQSNEMFASKSNFRLWINGKLKFVQTTKKTKPKIV